MALALLIFVVGIAGVLLMVLWLGFSLSAHDNAETETAAFNAEDGSGE